MTRVHFLLLCLCMQPRIEEDENRSDKEIEVFLGAPDAVATLTNKPCCAYCVGVYNLLLVIGYAIQCESIARGFGFSTLPARISVCYSAFAVCWVFCGVDGGVAFQWHRAMATETAVMCRQRFGGPCHGNFRLP